MILRAVKDLCCCLFCNFLCRSLMVHTAHAAMPRQKPSKPPLKRTNSGTSIRTISTTVSMPRSGAWKETALLKAKGAVEELSKRAAVWVILQNYEAGQESLQCTSTLAWVLIPTTLMSTLCWHGLRMAAAWPHTRPCDGIRIYISCWCC